MAKWNYGDKYKLYKMDKKIIIDNNSFLQVHDLYKPIPSFMKKADIIFVDPPCSLGNLNSFYTKADLERQSEFDSFFNKLFEVITEINPKYLYIEVFKSNSLKTLDKCNELFKHVKILESSYYHNNKNKCWIIACSNTDDYPPVPNKKLDEEDFIKWICENVDYKYIGDPCMGRGLVANYSYKFNKKFVGSELNHKRLAVCVDKLVKQGAKISYKEKEEN